jgi:poly-beta-1,6-N-acetyl-D-glucosamine synthase
MTLPNAISEPAPAAAATAGRLVLVTPCRNEQDYMRRTLDAVLQQTRPPALWVIVDDGSTDRTPAILAEYAQQHPCLCIVRRDDRGHRSVGPGVIEAFYHGLATVDLDAFEFVGKLDLDLDLPRDYFARLLDRMQADPRLGSCSGKPFYRDAAGREVPEFCDDEIVVGMTKLYRVACFQAIGGFVREVMWDGIDSHRCRLLGWTARAFRDAELRFEHLRPMGSSDTDIRRGRRRHGFGQWFMGTAPVYLLASALRRLTQAPYVIGSLTMVAGYVGAWWRGERRYDDLEFRRFLRRYQRRSLLFGKARTVAAIERETLPRWQASQRRP